MRKAANRPPVRNAGCQEGVEHLLAVRADPVRVEDPFGAEAVDQDEELVDGQREVGAVAELARLLGLGQVATWAGVLDS